MGVQVVRIDVSNAIPGELGHCEYKWRSIIEWACPVAGLASAEIEREFGLGRSRTSTSDYNHALVEVRNLLGPTTEAERTAALTECRRLARELIVANRGRVYRVARLLAERGELSGDDLVVALAPR